MIKTIRGLCLLAGLAVASGVAIAQGALTAGTYMLEGGSYTVSAEMSGDTLIVHEPSRDTTYTRQSDGSFHTVAPSGRVYGMRILDERTLEAFQPNDPDNKPTRLTLMSSATPAASDIPKGESDRWMELAQSYMAKTQSDPNNSMSWTSCGATAMKRASSSKAEADAYAAQMATMLKQMDAQSSPCPDVIQF